jgi:hypothetical protein
VKTLFNVVLTGALAVLVAGCVTPAPIPGARTDLLTFLRIGETPRQEVILKFGQPSASFEHETILTYRVGHEAKQGYYIITPKVLTGQQLGRVQATSWETVAYSLVLVFDGNGILQKQSLVSVQ